MPACPAEGAPRYRPRSASNPLKEIVEDALEDLLQFWDERFANEHGPLHPRVKKLFEAFTRCGDLSFGFLRLRCSNPECPKKGELLLGYSCKVRGLCPSCGQRRAIEWAERMVEEVLPRVPYRQLVFTIPRRFRKFFLFDRSLYGKLCRAAHSATRDFLRERVPGGFPKLKRAVPAMVVVPQSFGDLLVHHPHAHALCSLGLFLPDGSFFAMDDVDFTGLEDLFRERVFAFLIKAGKITAEVAEDMRHWPHSGFQADFQRKLQADDRKGLEGLLGYMDRPPVSLRRLTYLANGLVHYQGTKAHPRLETDHQLLPAVDFLALLVSHVMLRYQVTIRTYGALSTTFRKRVGWVENPPVHEPPREALTSPAATLQAAAGTRPPVPAPELMRKTASEEESEFANKQRSRWARLLGKTYLVDPELCPACGERMKIIAGLTSPHQDEAIEKILRHVGLWDPPWKRERKARGPPLSHQDSGDSLEEVDDLFSTGPIDPPWEDDI